MYTIDNGLMVLKYEGALERNKISMLISTIISYEDLMKDSSVKAIVLSLKNATQGTPEIFNFLIKELKRVEIKISLSISICEYISSYYNSLQEAVRFSNVNLFKTIDIAKLFLLGNKTKVHKDILVFDTDEKNQDNLCSALSLKGYSTTRVSEPTKFKQIISSSKYDIIITQTKIVTKNKLHKETLKLSKKVVQNILVFIDTAVDTVSSLTGFDAKKVSHGVKSFNSDISFDVIASMMIFKGDINGRFVLVFPKTLAVKTIESMLGEKVGFDDMDILKDGVGEFCNIITGGAKTQLSKKDLSVVFDLPKMYTDKESIFENIGQNKGIWIEMNLDDTPFYMYITD